MTIFSLCLFTLSFLCVCLDKCFYLASSILHAQGFSLNFEIIKMIIVSKTVKCFLLCFLFFYVKKPAVCKIILSALLKNCFICNFLLDVASSSFWHCFGAK